MNKKIVENTISKIKNSLVESSGGGGGYSGGNTFKMPMNGEGGNSYIGTKRSLPDLSSMYGGDNIGHGSIVIVPALPHPACGCDYRCVVLDEFSVNVKCICPEGWKLKKDNQTACECKKHALLLLLLFASSWFQYKFPN